MHFNFGCLHDRLNLTHWDPTFCNTHKSTSSTAWARAAYSTALPYSLSRVSRHRVCWLGGQTGAQLRMAYVRCFPPRDPARG
eukprot:scaffold14838_cov101-Isochrysis_galbana.AAC.5